MTFDPEFFFAVEALVPGEGWTEPAVLFVREPDGRYRVGTGADIATAREQYPNFFPLTLDEGYCAECGAKQIRKSR